MEVPTPASDSYAAQDTLDRVAAALALLVRQNGSMSVNDDPAIEGRKNVTFVITRGKSMFSQSVAILPHDTPDQQGRQVIQALVRLDQMAGS